MLSRIIIIFLLLLLSGKEPFLNAAAKPEKMIETLNVWDFKYTDTRTNKALTQVDNLFRKAYPEISLEHTGFFDQEYIPALRAALLAGTGPDIIWLHHGTEFKEYSSYMEALDLYLKKTNMKFRPSSLTFCQGEKNEQKALPLTFQGMGWYYNKELFRQAGLDPETAPDNWEEFMKACEQLVSKGITPVATGNNRPLTTEFIRRSLISAFFTEEEIQTFYRQDRGVSSPRYRLIMEFCRILRDRSYFDETGIFRPYFNYAPDTFSAGKAAMIPGLISDIAHWKNFSDALGKENLGYFPNLRHPLMAKPGVQLLQPAGVLVCINARSRNKDMAFKYLENLFSAESQKILTEELGMLIPLENMVLPMEEYPVLKQIQSALMYPGSDPEQYVPSVSVSDIQYRLDDLLINTREITMDEYMIKINEELRFY